jgi:hypothetical protein|tara:strand:- start:497 stop:634 length:138 start_codon:yes stop_codon:yes gene_type:complete
MFTFFSFSSDDDDDDDNDDARVVNDREILRLRDDNFCDLLKTTSS